MAGSTVAGSAAAESAAGAEVTSGCEGRGGVREARRRADSMSLLSGAVALPLVATVEVTALALLTSGAGDGAGVAVEVGRCVRP